MGNGKIKKAPDGMVTMLSADQTVDLAVDALGEDRRGETGIRPRSLQFWVRTFCERHRMSDLLLPWSKRIH